MMRRIACHDRPGGHSVTTAPAPMTALLDPDRKNDGPASDADIILNHGLLEVPVLVTGQIARAVVARGIRSLVNITP